MRSAFFVLLGLAIVASVVFSLPPTAMGFAAGLGFAMIMGALVGVAIARKD